jgi:cobalt-zinc-cadmium efflux system protein
MAHDHGHEHNHSYKSVAMQRLNLSLVITAVVMVVEIGGGYWTGSIALISDAGHMFTHAFAIVLAMFGIYIARRPACHHITFGWLRAEVLAAFINGLFLILVSVWIVWESIDRLLHPQAILSMEMFVIAILGLLVNLLSIYILEGSREGDLNIQAVFMHMIGDAASSVAIVFAAIIIRYTDWYWLDPMVSLLIAALIAIWAIGLLRDSGRVLLEMAPKGHNVHDIMDGLRKEFPIVQGAENEHVWTITQEVIVFTAHLQIHEKDLPKEDMNGWLKTVETWLHDHYDVAESTLQIKVMAD